jgi:hypothetical protein
LPEKAHDFGNHDDYRAESAAALTVRKKLQPIGRSELGRHNGVKDRSSPVA